MRYISDPAAHRSTAAAAVTLRKKKDSLMSDYEGLDQIVLTDMTTVPADTSACSAVTGGGGGFRRNSRTMTMSSTPGWRSYSRAAIQLTLTFFRLVFEALFGQLWAQLN